MAKRPGIQWQKQTGGKGVVVRIGSTDVLDQHLEELRASSLSDETITAAGIYSQTSKAVVTQLGYGHLVDNLAPPAFPLNQGWGDQLACLLRNWNVSQLPRQLALEVDL